MSSCVVCSTTPAYTGKRSCLSCYIVALEEELATLIVADAAAQKLMAAETTERGYKSASQTHVRNAVAIAHNKERIEIAKKGKWPEVGEPKKARRPF